MQTILSWFGSEQPEQTSQSYVTIIVTAAVEPNSIVSGSQVIRKGWKYHYNLEAPTFSDRKVFNNRFEDYYDRRNDLERALNKKQNQFDDPTHQKHKDLWIAKTDWYKSVSQSCREMDGATAGVAVKFCPDGVHEYGVSVEGVEHNERTSLLDNRH